jgi:asparagine synthase (glutamine-hydrolysing)
MCGIAGIVDFKKKISSVSIEKILSCIKHRGPDFKNIVNLKFSTLGFLRLSILDLTSSSNQPFQDSDRKVTIIYNGEIYNYKELKKIYFPKKKFKSSGDGEILLHLYIKFGIGFIEKIKGMFSICIIDEKFDKVFLVRDRFGIKPLYYYINKNNKIYFCSEIKGLFQINEIKKELNFEELYLYLKKGFINSTNQTLFKNIFQLPSGSFMTIDRDNIKIKKYYHLEDYINEERDYEKTSFKKTLQDINDKIFNSFEQHKNFDVKGGIHVSGGTDSLILSALANKFNLNEKLKTFTFTFENKNFSELEDVKQNSKNLNLVNESALLKDNELEDNIYDVLNKEYEPFSSLRVVSQHHLYKTFKNDTRVIFDGSGGDEIGAGYTYYNIPWYLDLLNDRYVTKENKRLFRISKKLNNNTIEDKNFLIGSLRQAFAPGSATPDGSTFIESNVINKDYEKNILNSLKFEIKRPFKSYLRNAQFADLYYLKLPRSLRYIDRASMSNSIEARVPFLDHELVEAFFQVPSRHKIFNNQQRALFKYNFKSYVDKKNLFRNKRTIADPQSYWLKNSLKNFSKDIFYSSNFDEFNLLDKKVFLNYHESFLKSSKNSNSYYIFLVLILELWFKEIFKK